MTKRFKSGYYSGEAPEWYWSESLHDAKIVKVEYLRLDNKTKRLYRNAMRITLDTSSCWNSLEDITFYNVEAPTAVERLSGCWWLEDVVKYDGKKYVIKITAAPDSREFEVKFSFDTAKIKRK